MIALSVTFFTSLSITSESSPILAYLLLLNMAVLVGVVFYFTSEPSKTNIFGGSRWYRIAEIWRPILLGLIIVLLSMIVLFVFWGFPIAEGSVGQKFHDVLFWAITVGFIEEYVRWTWLQTLPFSPLVANLVWVLLHPQVAKIFNGEAPNYFFLVWSLAFGLLATGIMWLYETNLPLQANRYFGPILAATIHAGYNSTTVIWKIEVVIPAQGETLFGPFFAPAIAIAGLVLLIASILIRVRGRARAGKARTGGATSEVDTWHC